MSVKKEADGRRSVQVEVEVPGTPEEVWQAIASGPGISAWFVPTRFETGEDGVPTRVVADFGPGMESVSTVTSWDPPRRFTADSADLGPEAPNIATEWIVEAGSGGTCVVRVVHSLFSDKDDWDNQLAGWEGGWPGFFRILRLYLAHFRGQSGSAMQFMGAAPEPKSDAWARLNGGLGLTGATVGGRVSSGDGAPRLAGIVEQMGEEPHAEELLLRLDEPAPGIAHLFAMPMGGQVLLSVRLYLYGDEAGATVAREEPVWRAWFQEHLPMGDMSALC
jgi:uncharacterized protein YndB with AHSA1/START domain